VVNFGPQTKKL